MAWFAKTISPKEKTPEERSEIHKGLWLKCEDCGEILYRHDIERNLSVCTKCNYHFRISLEARIAITFDENSFQEFSDRIKPMDALGFKDSKKYRDRLRESAKGGSQFDAIRCGHATIGGIAVDVGVFDFDFMGGSMGSVVGELLARLFERAGQARNCVLVFSSSGGARMQEGVLSLMQMAKTSSAVSSFRECGKPFVSVLLNPTTGGVAASFAFLGDVIIAEPKALIGFAGPRVIEQTIREKLPEGFQRSEFLLEHGMIDFIAHRKEMREKLISVLKLLG